MKFLAVWALVLGALSSVNAQDSNRNLVSFTPLATPLSFQTPVFLSKPQPIPGPGLRMKKTGTTLTIIGAAMAIGGIALMSSADELYYTKTTNQYGTYEEGDAKGALGVVMLVGGAGMTVTGVILWSKGAKKYRRHIEMQEGARATASLGGRGLSFTYHF